MSDLDIRTNTKGILINGLYKTELKYTDIEELNLSEKYPTIKLRTNGFSLMDTQLGYFRTTRGKNITLQIHSSSPCIHIKTINGEEIFLNSKDRQKTKEIYDTISSYISTH